MNDFINLLIKLDWQTVIAMFVIGWYFTREIRTSLTKLENDVKEQGRRTDKLYEMFIDLLKEGRK
jgi:hypothetical protein